MVTAAGRKVLQKAIFSFWERIPRRKTGELQLVQGRAQESRKQLAGRRGSAATCQGTGTSPSGWSWLLSA